VPRSIKINADISGFKKDIMGLSRTIQDMGGRHKLQILDKDAQKFLESGFTRAITGMKRHVEELKQRNKEITKELKNENIEAEKRIKLERESIANLRKMANTHKDINKLSQAQAPIRRGGTQRGQVLGGTGRLLRRIPGVGRFMGGAGLMGGLMGGALIAGGAAVTRGIQGFNQFDATKQSRIDLMGRGFRGGEVTGRNEGLQRLGLRPEQVRQMRMQMTDVFNREGSGNQNIGNVQSVARNLGVEAGQITGAVRGVRAQAGAAAAQKTFAQLQATLMATELKGAIGPFLETAAQMLTEINEDGIGMDAASLIALSSLAQQDVGGGEERRMRILKSMDETIRGATGERAAFFMSALTSAGMGAGSIGGAQLAMQQGLFGGGIGKLQSEGLLKPEELEDLKRQKIIGGDELFQERARAITKQFRNVAEGQGIQSQMLIADKIMGMRGGEGMRAMRLLERASDPINTPEQREKIQKQLEEMGKPIEERQLTNLEEINKSLAGQLDISQSLKEAGLETLGERLSPIAITMNELLATTDKGLNSIISLLGGQTHAEKALDKFKKGEMTIEDFKSLSTEQKKGVETEVRAHLQKQLSKGGNIDKKIKEAEDLGGRTKGGRFGTLGFATAEKLKFEKEQMEKTEKLWLEMLKETRAIRKASQSKTNTHSRGQSSTTPGS